MTTDPPRPAVAVSAELEKCVWGDLTRIARPPTFLSPWEPGTLLYREDKTLVVSLQTVGPGLDAAESPYPLSAIFSRAPRRSFSIWADSSCTCIGTKDTSTPISRTTALNAQRALAASANWTEAAYPIAYGRFEFPFQPAAGRFCDVLRRETDRLGEREKSRTTCVFRPTDAPTSIEGCGLPGSDICIGKLIATLGKPLLGVGTADATRPASFV